MPVPVKCDNQSAQGQSCGIDTYEIDVDRCKYVDQQKLKIQESPGKLLDSHSLQSLFVCTYRFACF